MGQSEGAVALAHLTSHDIVAEKRELEMIRSLSGAMRPAAHRPAARILFTIDEAHTCWQALLQRKGREAF